MAKDYYAILGVARGADWVTVHHAFRTLARRYHPDTGNASSSAKFREVLEAYQALRDPVQRRRHDIDLGVATRKRRFAAEPLFDPSLSAARLRPRIPIRRSTTLSLRCCGFSRRSIPGIRLRIGNESEVVGKPGISQARSKNPRKLPRSLNQ